MFTLGDRTRFIHDNGTYPRSIALAMESLARGWIVGIT